MSTENVVQRRMPAEWEPCEAVLIAWPHSETDWADMIAEVEECYDEMAKAITRFASLVVVSPHRDYVYNRLSMLGLSPESFYVFEAPTNDTWTRDYGPIATVDANGNTVYNDFTFNGWGLKFAADSDNLITRRLHMSSLLKGRYANRLSFVLEGGGIESDGAGTLMTTASVQLSPNRNAGLTRREISSYIKKTLGGEKLLWVEHGDLEGDDTDGHIDTLARFAPGNVILYVGCSDPSDSHYDELLAMKHQLASFKAPDGNPYSLIELPMPHAVYDSAGDRLPATYANFLIVNGGVLVPTYGQPKLDQLALQIIKIAFPEHEVVPVPCQALIKQHGSLHCATMQLRSINL